MSDLTDFFEEPPKIGFTLQEWQVIVWAYAYEIEDSELVPDSSFDDACKRVTLPSNIHKFDPSTGQWIHDVIKVLHGYKPTDEVLFPDHPFLAGCTKKLRQIGKWAAITHLRFPPGWLLDYPEWGLADGFLHIKQEGLDGLSNGLSSEKLQESKEKGTV